jgi:hypothetical protein
MGDPSMPSKEDVQIRSRKASEHPRLPEIVPVTDSRAEAAAVAVFAVLEGQVPFLPRFLGGRAGWDT